MKFSLQNTISVFAKSAWFKQKTKLIVFLLCIFCNQKTLAQDALGPNLSNAQFYFLIDADTKEVLISKNADVQIAPSSMTKMMTAYVVFDQIQKGRISFDNQCTISKEARRKSGSKMFLREGDVVRLEELIKGLLVVSGNDAATALAEEVSGSVANFADLMNSKAKEIGLNNSHFRNPHGLAEDGHYMTLRDLATLAIHLYQDFPQYSHYFGIPEFTYRNITQHNRNPLIRDHYDGVVGGKTGHTNEGGYGLIGMVKRDHRRLIGVVNKAHSGKERARIVLDLFDYGFEKFKKVVLFDKDQTIANLDVWLGKQNSVAVFSSKEIAINIPTNTAINSVKVKVVYKGPLYAPVRTEKEVARLIIEVKDFKKFEFPLFAKEKIDKAGYLQRIQQVIRYKFNNFLQHFNYKKN